MKSELVYSSREVKTKVQTSSEELSNYIKQQRAEAVVMMENRNARLMIKDYSVAHTPHSLRF